MEDFPNKTGEGIPGGIRREIWEEILRGIFEKKRWRNSWETFLEKLLEKFLLQRMEEFLKEVIAREISEETHMEFVGESLEKFSNEWL